MRNPRARRRSAMRSNFPFFETKAIFAGGFYENGLHKIYLHAMMKVLHGAGRKKARDKRPLKGEFSL
jgi:hypothetical protein